MNPVPRIRDTLRTDQGKPVEHTRCPRGPRCRRASRRSGSGDSRSRTAVDYHRHLSHPSGPVPRRVEAPDGLTRSDMTTALQQWIAGFQDARHTAARSSAVFLRDVGHGLLEVSHNGLALLGLAIVAIVLFMGSRADLRHAAESRALDWLRARHDARVEGTA